MGAAQIRILVIWLIVVIALNVGVAMTARVVWPSAPLWIFFFTGMAIVWPTDAVLRKLDPPRDRDRPD